MKMIHPDYQLEISMLENQITVVTVENPGAYSSILLDIWNGVNGKEARIRFENNGKIIKMDKKVECIFNPFNLDFNNKKVLNKIYQDLKSFANEVLINEINELNGQIISCLDKMIESMPYMLNYDLEMDPIDLFKMYQIRPEVEEGCFLENILEYIKIESRILNVDTFIFVGLKGYLREDELLDLYEFVFYNKINIVIFESMQTDKLKGEKFWILDKDLCIIEYTEE